MSNDIFSRVRDYVETLDVDTLIEIHNRARAYFWFNGYGNLESSDFLPDVVFPSDIARYIVDNDEDFGDDEIREVLDDGGRRNDL